MEKRGNTFLDLTGQRFNRLIAIKFAYIKNKHTYWLFKCDCGKEKIIRVDGVKNEEIKSCGCLNKELTAKRIFKHGMTKTRFYSIWQHVKIRCLDKNHKYYKNYGGRGITICERWMKFENFRDDMYQFYLDHVKKFGEKNTSINRKDNDGNYELSNCEFATYEIQANNTRGNHLITYKGETMTLIQWSRKLNLKKDTLYGRILTRGFSVEKAFEMPLNPRFRQITFNGRTLPTLMAWAKELNIRYEVLRKRLKLGWSIKKAFTTPINKAYQRFKK